MARAPGIMPISDLRHNASEVVRQVSQREREILLEKQSCPHTGSSTG
jgi:hypothetical protein